MKYALPHTIYLSFATFAATDSVKPTTWMGKAISIQMGLFVVIIIAACDTAH